MHKKTDACLLIHGFTGGPFEVMPLAEHLIENGYHVSVPTLAGHAGNFKELGQVTYQDWIASAEAALVGLLAEYQRVNIIGFSMGGLISIYLADKYDIKALVTLSAPVYVLDYKRIAENIYFGLKNKDYRRIEKYAANVARVPLKAALNFKLILKEAKPLISKINTPLLVIQGLKDDTVKPKSAEYIYNNAASLNKQIHYLPKSSHLVCLDVEKEIVFELVGEFIDSYSLDLNIEVAESGLLVH